MFSLIDHDNSKTTINRLYSPSPENLSEANVQTLIVWSEGEPEVWGLGPDLDGEPLASVLEFLSGMGGVAIDDYMLLQR